MNPQREMHVWMYWESLPGQQKAPYLELCLETIRLHLEPTMALHLLDERVTRKLAATHRYHDIPSNRIAPVLWYEWRRLLSPLQSPARVLESDPLTVMLWNSAMARTLADRSANQLLKSRVLLGRLFRIALGLSDVRQERDIATRFSFFSDLRFSTTGRRVEGRLRSLGALRS